MTTSTNNSYGMTPVYYDSGEMFSGRKSGQTVKGWQGGECEFIPAYNPNYVLPVWASDLIVWFMHMQEPLYVFGPTGCGKSSIVRQLAAKLRYPVWEVTGHSRLEFPELVGHHTVKNGDMSFEDGPLTAAMRNGGIFLLNEIDLLDPSTAAGLNSILDGAGLTIPETGEHVSPHFMFRFIATANSAGAGDETGLYQGVLRQNLAFMDRFILVEADYLPVKAELALIERLVPEIPVDVREKMVKFANMVRELFMGKDVEGVSDTVTTDITLSTRTLLRWALLVKLYAPLRSQGVNVVFHALDRALLFRASKVTAVSLREIAQRIF